MIDKNLIQSLPQYEPPRAVWEAIEARLPLIALPQYEPAHAIWDAIETNLEAQKPTQLRRLTIPAYRTGRMRGPQFRVAVAAAITVLIVVITGIFIKNSNANGNAIVTQEVIDNRLLIAQNDNDNADYKVIEELCKSDLAKCETPDFVVLKKELDELDTAKQTLKTAIGNYNNDADLVVQLTEIENQRSEIVHKILELM